MSERVLGGSAVAEPVTGKELSKEERLLSHDGILKTPGWRWWESEKKNEEGPSTSQGRRGRGM